MVMIESASGKLVMLVKKKIISFIVATLLVVNIFTSIGRPVNAEGYFPTASEEIAAINVGWNLGNTLDSYGTWISGTTPSSFETAWGNPVVTRELIQSVKAQGFNAIRIPVTWAQHIDDNGNVDPAWMARVKEVVDYAYEEDMYVILNVHHDTGEHGGDKVCWVIADEGTYTSTQDKFKALWTNIANEFESYDYHLMFEGYNEMLDMNNTWNAPSTGNGAYNAVNSYAQAFVDTVRATGGNNVQRNLIVNTYVASYDSQVINNFVVPNDSATNHLALQVHVYAPWGFTGTNATVNWTTVHSDFGDGDKSEIDGVMNAISNFSSQTGLPVIIGECGAEYKNNDAAIAQYFSYFISSASSKGIKCFVWDNGQFGTGSSEGGYAIVNRSNLEWKTDIVTAIVSNSTQTPIQNSPANEPIDEPIAETELVETTVVETTAEVTSATSETTIETTVENSEIVVKPKATETKKSGVPVGVYVGVGVVFVIGAYVGLFFLGKSKGKKQS